MKKPTLLIFALLLGGPVLAQEAGQSPQPGGWTCSLSIRSPTGNRLCNAFCHDPEGVLRPAPPTVYECPDSADTDQLPSSQSIQCMIQAELDVGLPQCHPPGALPSSDSESSRSRGGGDNRRKALAAGGMALAAVAVYNAIGPDLPDGFALRPSARVAYRDGFPFASVALSGEYGNWAFAAFSSHAGYGWSRPYAEIRWAWRF